MIGQASATERGNGSDSTAGARPQTRRTSYQTNCAAQPYRSARVAALPGQALCFFRSQPGALLCFETARSLRRENQRQPAHLFVSATEAPHRRSREEPLSGLPKSALVEKLHEFGGAPVEVLQNDELLDLMLPTVRADFELCETYEYHPESPLECPMTIYGGLEDHEVEAERLAAWREMTVGACEIRMFPGGHFYFNSSQLIFLQTFAGDLLRLRLQN